MKDFPIAQKITKVGNTAFDVQLSCKKEWERGLFLSVSLEYVGGFFARFLNGKDLW